MDIFIPLAALVVLLAAFFGRDLLARRRALGEARERDRSELGALELFACSKGGVVGEPGKFLMKIDGHRAWVEVSEKDPYIVSVAIEVDAALDLEIRRPKLWKRRRGSARVSAVPAPGESEQPDIRFDVRRAEDKRGAIVDELFVHAGDALERPLASLLYQLGADAVVAQNGRLGVVVDVHTLLVERVRAVLEALAAIASAYSRKPVVPSIGTLVERYLWLDGKTPRCPYCHVDIAEGETDLAACGRCKTLHHEGCFAEHGGCTLLGCGGVDRAAPARV
jgi:hypothetical protein